MSINKLSLKVLAFLFFSLASAATAGAQQAHTYVATTGSDNNPCTRTDPCRTFAAAIAQTNNKGDATALDTGVFGGAVTITRSITLTAAPGVHAELALGFGATTDLVTVDTGFSDVVVIRNLYLDGHSPQRGGAEPPPMAGIRFDDGGTLHVENCVINGFSSSGIVSNGRRLYVKDTTIRNCSNGFDIEPIHAGSVNVIEHCRLENNSRAGVNVFGFATAGIARVTISNTIATRSKVGYLAVAGTGPVEMYITNSVASNNQSGVESNGCVVGCPGGPHSTTVYIAYSTVTGNSDFGLYTSQIDGTIYTFRNNMVGGNGTDVQGNVVPKPVT
jgi:hypothetical protein